MVSTIKCVEKRLQCVTSRGIRNPYFDLCTKGCKYKSNHK